MGVMQMFQMLLQAQVLIFTTVLLQKLFFIK